MAQPEPQGALHSIGRVRMMKFVLSSDATEQEVSEAFGSALGRSLQYEVKGSLVITQGRPSMTPAELKAAVGALDSTNCPEDFRIAVVAFQESAYQAYRHALSSLAKRGACRVFNDELDALEWLREQFPD